MHKRGEEIITLGYEHVVTINNDIDYRAANLFLDEVHIDKTKPLDEQSTTWRGVPCRVAIQDGELPGVGIYVFFKDRVAAVECRKQYSPFQQELKQVIVIRKDLNMRRGKQIAQGAHASLAAILQNNELISSSEVDDWLKGIFTKVCVSVDTEQDLFDVYNKAKEAGLHCSLIQDSGLTEFKGIATYTAVAVGPGKNNDVDKITGHLKLL